MFNLLPRLFTPKQNLEPLVDVAKDLHLSVPFGDNSTMFYQVLRCRELARQTNDPALEAVALLHKSQEPSKIAYYRRPLSDEDITNLVGYTTSKGIEKNVSAALKDLKAEPRPLEEKLKWSQKIRKLAKGMLLIEKIINFEESIDSLNHTKENPHGKTKGHTPEWHLRYFNTRMPIVDNVRNSYPKLFDIAENRYEIGTSIAKDIIAQKDNSATQGYASGRG